MVTYGTYEELIVLSVKPSKNNHIGYNIYLGYVYHFDCYME